MKTVNTKRLKNQKKMSLKIIFLSKVDKNFYIYKWKLLYKFSDDHLKNNNINCLTVEFLIYLLTRSSDCEIVNQSYYLQLNIINFIPSVTDSKWFAETPLVNFDPIKQLSASKSSTRLAKFLFEVSWVMMFLFRLILLN